MRIMTTAVVVNFVAVFMVLHEGVHIGMIMIYVNQRRPLVI